MRRTRAASDWFPPVALRARVGWFSHDNEKTTDVPASGKGGDLTPSVRNHAHNFLSRTIDLFQGPFEAFWHGLLSVQLATRAAACG